MIVVITKLTDSFCFVTVITCFNQEPPTNGQFQNTPQAIYGSVLSIECNEGYFLEGTPTIHCNDTDEDGLGEWNGTLGYCKCE